MTCENAQMRRGHSISEHDLQPTRAEGDTAARAVAIDSGLGSERLELHVTPLRARPLAAARPRAACRRSSTPSPAAGTLFVDGEAHELEPSTGAYVAAGESYEVENPGPETLLVVSATAPQENGGDAVRPPHRPLRRPADRCRRAATVSFATSSRTRSAAAT